MAGAAAAAGFAVEIFVEKNEIAPVRIVRVFPNLAMTRARALLVRQKDAPKPACQFTRYLLERGHIDRKSTRLNSSHLGISYAVFCLKKKKQKKKVSNSNIIYIQKLN